MTSWVVLWATPVEKKAWEAAAEKAGKASVSEWLREIANWAAQNQRLDSSTLTNNAIALLGDVAE